MQVDAFRAVDHNIATGVQPDMTEHAGVWTSGRAVAGIEAADILVLAGPIWLSDNSSVTNASSSGCTRSRTC